jgi:hypothetical protein
MRNGTGSGKFVGMYIGADIDAVLQINNRQLEMIAELQEVLRRLDPERKNA